MLKPPTLKQQEVLETIAANSIFRNKWFTYWQLYIANANVTLGVPRRLASLEKAGWLEGLDGDGGLRNWRLTPAGREAIDFFVS